MRGTQDLDQRSAEFLLRYRSGDESAFDGWVALWDRRILELCFRLLGDLTEAEDVRQQAWIRIYQGLGSLRREASATTWVARIAVNLCRDCQRRRAAHARTLARTWAREEEPSALASAAHDELKGEVARLVLALPDDLRECLVLRHYHDLSVVQVARAVGKPRTTVQDLLRRALEQVAAGLRRKGVSSSHGM